MSTLDLEALEIALQQRNEALSRAQTAEAERDAQCTRAEAAEERAQRAEEKLADLRAGVPSCQCGVDEACGLFRRAQAAEAERDAQRERADGLGEVVRTREELNSALHARFRELEAGIKQCQEQFRFYAQQHAAKSPPDYTKAQTNLDMASMCECLLQQPAEGEKP